MTRRARIRALVVLAVACAMAVGAAVPGLDRPFRRLASYHADTADPIWDHPGTDGPALRQAAKLIPGDSAYFIYAPQNVPGLQHDLMGAGFLLFAPALPSFYPDFAQWVLNYQRRPLVPPHVTVLGTRSLGNGIVLLHVRRKR